jgi:hypothetical protein
VKHWTVILILMGAPVHAVSLPDDPHVTRQLVAAQVGDIIRTICPTISARVFVVVSEIWALERHAKAAGHTDADIRAFLDSPSEKQRIKTLALDYLRKAGAKTGDVESYCKVGRDEIANQTVTGSLLRSSQ